MWSVFRADADRSIGPIRILFGWRPRTFLPECLTLSCAEVFFYFSSQNLSSKTSYLTSRFRLKIVLKTPALDFSKRLVFFYLNSQTLSTMSYLHVSPSFDYKSRPGVRTRTYMHAEARWPYVTISMLWRTEWTILKLLDALHSKDLLERYWDSPYSRMDLLRHKPSLRIPCFVRFLLILGCAINWCDIPSLPVAVNCFDFVFCIFCTYS